MRTLVLRNDANICGSILYDLCEYRNLKEILLPEENREQLMDLTLSIFLIKV